MMSRPIPVVDLFAGPGGLGEGFSSLTDSLGSRIFDVRVSIEKDPVAHRTLSLRALFRSFPKGRVPDCYYDYVRDDITREEMLSHPSVPDAAHAAYAEAKNATLGEIASEKVDQWIRESIGNSDPWVLIGGPPCQAYSIAGRSRMRGADPKAFEEDKRHFLYREYLRIIRGFGPAIFVMENVKGILTSKHGGSLIFERILEDLSRPGNGLEYDIRSFVVDGRGDSIRPQDFIIEAENFEVPQMRHRVILFGVRRDLSWLDHDVLPSAMTARVSVRQAVSGLPPLRSRLSREPDSFESWFRVIKEAPRSFKGWRTRTRVKIEERMREAVMRAAAHQSTGGRFVAGDVNTDSSMPTALRAWYHDPRLGGTTLHETRAHMRSDLHRYLFASCFAAEFGCSPKLAQFPEGLLPNHGNVEDEEVPFADRFRVQIAQYPSTTVVSHISKDGHYYIHPDPAQCRSLTVREAARLQTFPDNYFFEGSRTEQYVQVGNAVPPYLARQIAGVVSDFLARAAIGQRNCA
ncbi:MAG: DNA cytosine methyltransferase [Zoogloeaceae bacterium]|nr:DNA cytosine methyltransferase [Zoogloeaceae bacterium]